MRSAVWLFHYRLESPRLEHIVRLVLVVLNVHCCPALVVVLVYEWQTGVALHYARQMACEVVCDQTCSLEIARSTDCFIRSDMRLNGMHVLSTTSTTRRRE